MSKTFEILNQQGEVINRIVAESDWVAANFPDFEDGKGEIWPQYREVVAEAAPVAPPSTVTMPQARKAIILSGVGIAAVEAAIADIADDTARELALTDWEYSPVVRRDSELVQSLAPVLGADLDQLFTLAASL